MSISALNTRSRMLGLVAVGALGLSACQTKAESPRTLESPVARPTAAARAEDTSLVRVIHAIPGGVPADVFADEDKVFSALEYKAVTDYQHVEDNQVTFKLRAAGQPGDAMAENGEMLADGSRYTVVAMPGKRGTAGELKILTDEKDAPTEGKARVRVVNAAADAGKLEVMLGGREDALVGGLDAADDVGYRDVVPVAGELRIRDKDSKRVVAESSGAAFEAGKSYTMVIVGRVAGKPKAEVLIVEDGRGSVPRRTAMAR